jgi:hypothetical protein
MVLVTIDGQVVVEMHLECTVRTPEKGVCSTSILRIIRKVGRIIENYEDLRCPKASENPGVSQSTRAVNDSEDFRGQ